MRGYVDFFFKIAQLVLDPHLFSAKDCYPVIATGSSDSCLGRQNLSNIKRFTGYTVYVCISICVMVLKILEDLNFQNVMKYFLLSGNTRYMLHVFDCYETCWYTVYYILLDSACRSSGSVSACCMTVALPFWSLRSARIVWILSQCSFLTCSCLGSTKSCRYRLDGYTALEVQDRPL